MQVRGAGDFRCDITSRVTRYCDIIDPLGGAVGSCIDA